MRPSRPREPAGAKLAAIRSWGSEVETRMKTLATLAAASMLALSGAALAQTPPAPPAPADQAQPQDGRPDRRPGLTRAEMDALTNARIAGIRAGLNLTAEQQALFAPVEQALRTMATERANRWEERRERRGASDRDRLDLAERLARQAERATRTAQNLTALSGAMQPFYASLDEGQKRLLPRLMRPAGGYRHAMRHHGGRGGPMEHGPDRP
jgi:zinc resistance-associated protein